MKRALFAALALALIAAPASAAGISGKYIEARTCDVWTGPCFANAEINLTGKNAVMAWTVDKGSFDGVKLDGLGVVAVLAASDTLGTEQSGKGKAVLILDSKATKAQQKALTAFVKKQAGKLVDNVVLTTTAKVELTICPCDNNGCATLQAGDAKIETRCLGKHDQKCGNETEFFPPLAEGVKASAAVAVENTYKGKGLGTRWDDAGRRGAYLGTFTAR